MRKVRTNFFYPPPLMARLRRHSELTFIGLSELVRQAIERFLDAEEPKVKAQLEKST